MREQMMYFSDDNVPCDTRDEALARDEALKQKDAIQSWMENEDVQGKKIAEYNRVLMSFLAFTART